MVQSPIFHALMYVILVVATLYVLSQTWRFITGRRYIKLVSSLELLAMMYLVGVPLKLLFLGPAFIRWHLADAGFTAALAGLMLAPVALYRRADFSSEKLSEKIRVQYDMMRTYRVLVVVALALAIGYEYFAGWAVTELRKEGRADGLYIGAFDSVDVAFYIAGSTLALWLATKAVRLLDGALSSAIQVEEQGAREAKRLRRHSPRK